MLCPRCQTENPAQARFCMNCGNPLVRQCANCRANLAPGARFCMACGEPVLPQTPADEARFSRLAASTPEPLQQKIRTAVIQGEVRQVAVLLVDVVASTRLAEQLTPESYTAVMNGAFDRIAPLIYRYEGAIARLLGDSLLAFFGAPVAHEDDAVRAVRTALDIITHGEQYAAEVQQEHGVQFALRTCLHLGEVVFNTQADSLQYQFDPQGGAVNVVSRLKFAAGPGTVLITAPLYRRVAPFFECQPGEQITIRGISEPVQVYTVTGIHQQDTRLRGLPGLASPMVGREAELHVLLQQAEAARAGLGRAVLITGEPGLGKTRLVEEWQGASRAANPAGLYWTQGRCMSFSENQAYSLLVDWLRDVFKLAQAADELEAVERLTDRLQVCLGPQIDELRPVFAYLLSLPLEDADLAQIEGLEPQARQARYVSAVQELVRSLAQARPLAIVLEDLHWADPSSTELFSRLLPLTDELPLLLCLVSREEPDAAGWQLVVAARQRLRGSLTELRLGPLTDQDSQALVANLLEIEALPDAVRRQILKRAEGNPFFVEEVIRMLIDRGVIVRQGQDWVADSDIDAVEIPDNLQSLLLARIDRLPEEAREALLVAAVIGRQFPVRVLAEVLGGSAAEFSAPEVALLQPDPPSESE